MTEKELEDYAATIRSSVELLTKLIEHLLDKIGAPKPEDYKFADTSPD